MNDFKLKSNYIIKRYYPFDDTIIIIGTDEDNFNRAIDRIYTDKTVESYSISREENKNYLTITHKSIRNI